MASWIVIIWRLNIMRFIRRTCLYLVPFFMWFCHAGIVTDVTRADIANIANIKGKAVVLLHDCHYGYIDIQGEPYEVSQLAVSQQKPLYTYFDQLFKKLDGKLPVLLECRPVLKKQLQQLQKGQSNSWLQGFFEQFYNAYAKPQEHERLNTLCDIDNFDERNAQDNQVGTLDMHFGPLAKRILPNSLQMGLLNHPEQIEELDAKKEKINMVLMVKNPQYQQEKQNMLAHYGDTKIHQWFSDIKKRVEGYSNSLKPIIGQTKYFAQMAHNFEIKLTQVERIVRRYTIDHEDILNGMYAYLEGNGSFAQLRMDLSKIFKLICSITDLQLLHDILTTQEELIFVHLGGDHACQLETDLENLGAEVTRQSILETAEDINNPMRLYEKLQKIAPVNEIAQKISKVEKTNQTSIHSDEKGFFATIVSFLKKILGLFTQ